MNTKQAISTINRYHPCPHDNADTNLGIGQFWAKCEDCGVTFDHDHWENYRKESAEFDEAIDVLQNSKGEINMKKTLHNSDVSGARKNVKDIVVVGNGDMFRLLCKAYSEAEGWMKSTKAMEVEGGCVVQVTTQQRNPDGSYAIAEALTFVPGVRIVSDENNGRRLIPIC